MPTEIAIHHQFAAVHAAIKTLIEVALRAGNVSPQQLAGTLNDQAAQWEQDGFFVTSEILRGYAEFAGDPNRSAARRLLDEPPHGSA